MDVLLFVLIVVLFGWLAPAVVSLIDMLLELRNPRSATAGAFAALPQPVGRSKVRAAFTVGTILVLAAALWPLDVVRAVRR